MGKGSSLKAVVNEKALSGNGEGWSNNIAEKKSKIVKSKILHLVRWSRHY